MGPIPGKRTQDVAKPCFQTDAIECQGFNVLRSAIYHTQDGFLALEQMVSV